MVTASDYDTFAIAYSAEIESNLFNAYYERPAMLGLAGEVSGRRILDAGCGSGPLSAELHARGAVVTGVDASAAMVDLARQRLGEDADVHVADLGAPLPVAMLVGLGLTMSAALLLGSILLWANLRQRVDEPAA